jgi:N-acetyl-anhydromuramyl-L-alanine amidase AmpD
MKIHTGLSLKDHQYYKTEHPKKIIVLHHTVSGESVEGDVHWWSSTPERVATAFIIDRETGIYQLFKEKYWANHLGISAQTLKTFGSDVTNKRLNEISIGIEIDSWGGLIQKNGRWFSVTGKEIPLKNVQLYPKGYRGFFGFEKYTPKQIANLRELLLHLSAKWNIALNYHENIFEANAQALKGTWGVWSHVSYRPDKSDCHPQPELIAMLKSLAVKT